MVSFETSRFAFEVVVLSVENFVFAEFAFESAVHHRNAVGRFQSDVVETFIAITEYPCVETFEYMFQLGPDHRVKSHKIIAGDTFSIRRIGN